MHKIEKVTLPNVKYVVAVAAGKGGVGKSTVAANLALSFAQNGYKTALVDADLFGPSIPILFGLEKERGMIEIIDEKQMFVPVEKFGVKLMSIGFLVDSEQALIWRGPMAASALLQLFSETNWGEIDFMVVDLPPGTSDIPLTLCQQVDVDGVIIVTTPQLLSISDVIKAITMFRNRDLNIPLLGIVENMSWFSPVEHPDEKYFLFGKDGGKILAEKYCLELLSQIPLVQGMSEAADKGSFYNYSQSKIVQDIYRELVSKLLTKLNSREMKIAVPVTSNFEIDDHFGHCEFYNIYTISDKNEIVDVEKLESPQGCGCKSDIASVLSQKNVSIMLAGGIGDGAINVLNRVGIEVIRGCSGKSEDVIKLFLSGLIKDNGESCQQHTEHHADGKEHVCSHKN